MEEKTEPQTGAEWAQFTFDALDQAQRGVERMVEAFMSEPKKEEAKE